MGFFNIVWVSNYVDITQNAAFSRLKIFVLDRWWYTDNLQTLSSTVLFFAMKVRSSEITRFNGLLVIVSATTRDDSTWATLLERLSTVEIRLPLGRPNVSINLSLSLCKLITNLIKFSFLKSFSVISVWAVCKYKFSKNVSISCEKWLRYICNFLMT